MGQIDRLVRSSQPLSPLDVPVRNFKRMPCWLRRNSLNNPAILWQSASAARIRVRLVRMKTPVEYRMLSGRGTMFKVGGSIFGARMWSHSL